MFKTLYDALFEKVGGKHIRPVFSLILAALLPAILASLAFAQGNVLTDPPKNYELVRGWYQGRETFYYDFGANTSATADGLGVTPAPIYVLVTGFDADGAPQVVAGQNNIVDVIPGDAGYSDLWEVTFVTVPEDYVANSIKSADELLNNDYELTPAGVYVNCPIVPAGSTLAEGGDLVQGWYKGQAVYYFDFGENPPTPAPIYVLVTGFDADGNPQVVPGQSNIVDVIPGDDGYSAFWQVNFVTVPADYQANSITSAPELLAANYETTQPGVLVNCPIVRTADEAAVMAESEATMAEPEAPVAQEAPAQLPATGGESAGLSLWLIVTITGAVFVIFGWFLRARVANKGQAD
jgi:hypothetical protein